MTDMDVLKFINTGAKKKPRGKRAGLIQKIQKENRIINKRNPFRFFKDLDISVMRDEIDDFVEKTEWITDKNPDKYTELSDWDKRIISMFGTLKTGIPGILVKDFFMSFDDDPSNNIVQFFKEYKERPDVRVRIDNMNNLLKRREAIPNSKRKIEEVSQDYRIAKTINQNKKIIDTPVQRAVPIYQTNEIKSRCEQHYQEAPWMFAFTDRSIKGFALNDNDRKYTIDQQVMPGWNKVSKEWYRMACRGERVFIPDFVGYLTNFDEIIIESEDMYKASKRDWINEYTPLTKVGYKIAKELLMENVILKSTYSGPVLISYVNDIIASFGTLRTNYDLARRISYVLVFLSSIIDRPQKYHTEFRSKMYTGDQLLTLSKNNVLLPEIDDPGTDVKLIDNKISTLRRLIEKKYYNRVLKDNRDPVVRRRLGRVRYEAPARKSLLNNQCTSFEPNTSEKQCESCAPNMSEDKKPSQKLCKKCAPNMSEDKEPSQKQCKKCADKEPTQKQCKKCGSNISEDEEPFQKQLPYEALNIIKIQKEPVRRRIPVIVPSIQIQKEPVETPSIDELVQKMRQPKLPIQITVGPTQTSEERLKLMTPKIIRKQEELAPGLLEKLRDIIGQKSPIECNKCHKEVSGAPYSTPFQSERLTFCGKKCFENYNI